MKKLELAQSAPEARAGLAQAIRAAARSTPRPRPPSGTRRAAGPARALRTTDKLVAIGASTGGPAAIEQVLTGLPVDMPGAIIVQHMPVGFTAAFAARLDSLCALTVREAKDGDRIAPGLVLIAPAGIHAHVQRSGAQFVVRLKDGPRIHHQKPAVDVLFHSVAQQVGPNAVGVVLTGLGQDGAAGLRAMRAAGARTIAESETTCVVYGMPRVAVEMGGVERVLPLDGVADGILQACG